MWIKRGLAWLSLALVISLGQCTGACCEFALEPIKSSFILSGVCSPSEANYCSNPFEVFFFQNWAVFYKIPITLIKIIRIIKKIYSDNILHYLPILVITWDSKNLGTLIKMLIRTTGMTYLTSRFLQASGLLMACKNRKKYIQIYCTTTTDCRSPQIASYYALEYARQAS